MSTVWSSVGVAPVAKNDNGQTSLVAIDAIRTKREITFRNFVRDASAAQLTGVGSSNKGTWTTASTHVWA